MVRRRTLPLIAAFALASCNDSVLLAPPSDATAARVPAATEASRYLVGFADSPSIAPDVLAASGGRVVDSIPAFHVLVVEGATNPDALRAAQPAFIEAEFVSTVAPYTEPLQPIGANAVVPDQQNTPWVQSGALWGMRAIHADQGWAQTSGGAGVNACIVDTGIDATHQELSPRVIAVANFVTAEPRTDDPNGHGSHVSGTVAGGGVVISGVAPRANLLGARVLSAAGSGTETAIVNGINWCVANGAHVINMSLGGTRYRGQASYISSPITYGLAINAATAAGVVVVTSAGNSNLSMPNPAQITVPAEVPGTIIVGATGPLTKSTAPLPPAWDPYNAAQVWYNSDHRAYYSNYGPEVHVFAPGGRGGVPLSEPYRFVDRIAQGGPNDQIWSVCSSQTAQTGSAINVGGVPTAASGTCSGATNRYIAYAGTSMAAPHVTGMAAVLYGEIGGAPSAAKRARVENCIKTTTDDIGPSTTYGGGRINVQKAIAALHAGTC